MKLVDDVVITETDYGYVLLNVVEGTYFNVNPTGTVVLRALLEGGAAAEAADRLTQEFDVTPEEAARDVADLIAEFRRERLLAP
ncbi:hypothetical protein GCM10012275_10560 [Longimycelium tulufanense]|uniref:PqqD family protein n=1 Tax=Longimycelium tulufanense TaxID=907463 RepID=A0A8J3CB33_9PSEU|nr:lasso peptide biosynthesis PqqD family chaperone [Longimycelium tulufanense]GGM41443.1 hypothetical protein GCM10012275_10560 [Longimycelium tulufanense]